MSTDSGVRVVSSSKFPPKERIVSSVYASAVLPSTVITVPDDGSTVVVPFDTVEYDPHQVFDFTNNLFVVPKTGAYKIKVTVCWLDSAPAARLTSIIAVLGAGSSTPTLLTGKGLGHSQVPPLGTPAAVVVNQPEATLFLKPGDRVGIVAAVQVATPIGATYDIVGITGGPFRATTASLIEVS
jgi:hypothetical protein